jgi:hypothetical protein
MLRLRMTRSTQILVVLPATVAALWIPLSGRSTDSPLETAALAWDRGDYITALNTYLQVLDSAGANTALETIALQTGELFRTVELTTDGAAPRFSPDGAHVTFETGPPPRRVTRLLRTDDPAKTVAELKGYSATFSPDGTRLAYLKAEPSAALSELHAAIENAPQAQRQARTAAFNLRLALDSKIFVRDLASNRETELPAPGMRKTGLVLTSAGVLFSGSTIEQGAQPQIYTVAIDAAPRAITTGEGDKQFLDVSASGAVATYSVRIGGSGRGDAGALRPFGILRAGNDAATTVMATSMALSSDGSTVAYVTREAAEYRLTTAPAGDLTWAAVARKGPERLDAPALSRDGRRIAFQMMPKEDWEIFLINRDGSGETRVTREIQHDILPRFLDDSRLLGMIGEARHRRSHIHDLNAGTRTRVFHNNTVRTIAPEYAWVPSADGRRLLIVSERDGDTVSLERGVYLVDMTRRVTRDELRTRLRTNLAAEQALRAKARRLYAPIAADVKRTTDEASVARVYAHEKALFDFDSKHITRPGNKRAAEYLYAAYKSFGYEPEYQWFAGRGALGGQTANVIATLEGTVNPELVYVVSSHYDSVAAGPGADDDTSGTAALLETARILAGRPQPATIVFASFTGEEAGLLGSREFVRRAVAGKIRIVGALNNDMVGWANDHRLDNTIRYSNAGIRDIQHAAAMQFSNMITYDALYYKSTDAAAYYEAYGDIVGGIGSYPVLGNPHYHQSHDLLDTINHQLVTEVAKTTAATLMLLASSPSRLTDLKVTHLPGAAAKVSWTPSPENGITGYIVTYGPASNPEAQQLRVTQPSVTIPKAPAGTVISAKAVNAKGLESWDWARIAIK